MKRHKSRFAGLVAALLLGGTAAHAGTITAYTSLEEDDARVYLEAFQAAHPDIKVNLLRLSTGDLGARMLAEKANPRQDVIWGWAVTQMVDPRILEMIEPYKPKGIDKVNPAYKDSKNRWFATTGYLAGFCVNTQVLKDKKLREKLSRHAKETVRKKFLLTRLVEQYLDLFDSFISNYRLKNK